MNTKEKKAGGEVSSVVDLRSEPTQPKQDSEDHKRKDLNVEDKKQPDPREFYCF